MLPIRLRLVPVTVFGMNVSVFGAVLPLVGLIGIGAMVRRLDLLGPGTASELNRFVMTLALPAMLFSIMAKAKAEQFAQGRLVLAFTLSMLSIFLPMLVLARRRGRSMGDASIDALCASYANTGFMGIPLATYALGVEALPAVGVSVIMTACVLFALALILIESAHRLDRSLLQSTRAIACSIGRNPLVWAPLLGAVMALCQLELPSAASRIVDLLGAAASPCALIVLGMFVAERRAAIERGADVIVLSTIKLVGHPLIAWLVAGPLLQLPDPQVQVVVLMALLPTGTGPFMLAERYALRANLSSNVILATTVLSIITITTWLSLQVR